MSTATSTEQRPDKFLTLRVPADLHDQLLELAKRNDRTLAAEARRAFRNHLKGASA